MSARQLSRAELIEPPRDGEFFVEEMAAEAAHLENCHRRLAATVARYPLVTVGCAVLTGALIAFMWPRG